MKITMEATEMPNFPVQSEHRTVSISVPGDDWGADRVKDLLQALCLAWGFEAETVRGMFSN